MPAIDSIKIRMYRHGFGDCFLLQFMEEDKRISSMLIDCGLKNMDSEDKAKLKDVVADIAKELTPAGKDVPELDFLVVTHEHWDHVSGFVSKRKLFDDFVIGQVWMAWTEDPNDLIAQQINKRLKKTKKALAIANEKIKENLPGNQVFYQQFYRGNHFFAMRESFSNSLNEIIGFSQLEVKGSTVTTPSGIQIKKFDISEGTEDALNHVKSFADKIGGAKYFSPGKVIQDRKKFPGIRMYVLGPPKNAHINKDLPTEGRGKETYFTLRDASLDGFVGGLLSAHDAATALPDAGTPFDFVSMLTIQEVKQDDLYINSYFDPRQSWRTIEDDWLDISGALALQMDDDTNNTSLVLAMEFIGSGKVLLFPGDAQVGSWESWHDVSFKVKHPDKTETVTTADLLSRTVLYKVSHHCSHNATLKKNGLELMTSDDLVALIPEKQDQYSGIPHPPLVERLRQKTKGRMIFSADVNFPANDFKSDKPRTLSKAEWNEFIGRLEINDLFIEIPIHARD